jgi:hypothetical protein
VVQLLYPAVQQGLLDKEHVLHLLEFHQAAVKAVQQRDIGRGQGAAAEPNLRDLIKVGGWGGLLLLLCLHQPLVAAFACMFQAHSTVVLIVDS